MKQMQKMEATDALFTRCGSVYPQQQSRALMRQLLAETEWQKDYLAFGRRIDIPRMQAWYADPGIDYRYSDNQLITRDWTERLSVIRQRVQTLCGYDFNSVLLTCYRNGDDYVGWHADNETELGDAPVIASLSLGSERRFHYRHNHSDRRDSIALHDGELLIMHPVFQHDWQHAVLSEPSVHTPRINLTFRKVVTGR